jgi:peptidoglycan LD-endopeptidase LytH
MKIIIGKTPAIIFTLLFIFSAAACAGPIDGWQELETAVRDGKIAKQEAVEKLRLVTSGLTEEMDSRFSFEASSWAFPLEGGGISSVIKGGFKPKAYYGPYHIKGYSFYDGNRHGGHPAYDIFTEKGLHGKMFKGLAIQDAVVLSINTGWKRGDKLRGGNYVWLFNPAQGKYYYYAHLKDVYVKPGEFVKAGSPLGSVGRTGILADSKASPTHIHLMVLDYNNGEMTPFDYYNNVSGSD